MDLISSQSGILPATWICLLSKTGTGPSFIQQIVIERLLGTRYNSRCWEYSCEQKSRKSHPHEAYILRGEERRYTRNIVLGIRTDNVSFIVSTMVATAERRIKQEREMERGWVPDSSSK